jgi:hypothetical protein
MTIPILGKQPEGVCIACKGPLTPDHEHMYVDTKLVAFTDKLLEIAINNDCLIPTDEGKIFPGHPKLEPGWVWYPVRVTHVEAHDACTIAFPHHHCDKVGTPDGPIS